MSANETAPDHFCVYGNVVPTHPFAVVVDATRHISGLLTYGAHKRACEILVAEASRRGEVDGYSLRLPGVVARSNDGEGLMSSFMSQIFWRLANDKPITVPVSAGATCWWMSVGACVDNYLRFAAMDSSRSGTQRCYQMPLLHSSIADALNRPAEGLVTYAPDPLIEPSLGSLPLLSTPVAEAIGLCHDGSLTRLVHHALAQA